MRTLKLQVQVSIDGFVARPGGEMDWTTWEWDDPLKQYVAAITQPVDCILLGHRMAGEFIPYWAEVAANENDPQFAAGKKFTETAKVVFSRTATRHQWPNTRMATGDLVPEVLQLKEADGEDIIAYGGASFVSALIENRLVDDYHLFINPVAIGAGLSIFQQAGQQLPLSLIKATAFDSGMVVLHYRDNR